MGRHQKANWFKGIVRLACHFPGMVKTCYRLYQFIVVRIPFMKASYKWKMIVTQMIHFEFNKVLWKRNKHCTYNSLYEVNWEEVKFSVQANNESEFAGTFALDVVWNGLVILGQIDDHAVKNVEIKIDDKVLRKINISADGYFYNKVQPAVLGLFPKESYVTISTDNKKILVYKKSAVLKLSVPFGTDGLRLALDNGHLLSKKGGMKTDLLEINQRQDKFLVLYGMVKNAFTELLGVDLFLTYGTLLGYVREGDFIPNDDDFDAGYISSKETPELVKKEAVEYIDVLLDAGFHISINPVGRLFKIHKDTGVHLDLMPVWFDGIWNVAYRGAGVKISRDDFIPVKKGLMRGVEVFIPNNPGKFLQGYYGDNWKTPDPGYVSDLKQTGKTLEKNYSRFLMTPYEFFKVRKLNNKKRGKNPEIGLFTASGLKVDL